MSPADCVFCDIVSGKIPATVEYNDETVLAFWDIKPLAKTHLLVIPKIHLVSLDQISPGSDFVLGQLQRVIGQLIAKLGIADGYKIIVNGGRFQEIKHLHYHLLAGFNDPDRKF